MIAKSNRLFLFLTITMAIIVILSNYLVQFPINYYGLQEILTYGAFSYPITFFITDLTNRAYGKAFARKIVNIGFLIGILLTLFVSTNFSDYISIRIAIGSGTAFLVAQNIDINIFDRLKKNKIWFIAPLVSSLIGSIIDTFLFFSISFYNTGVPWTTLAFGDFGVKLLIALIMLIPFRLLLYKIKSISEKKISYIKI
jgi:queuosine precursor transporter